MRPVENFPGIAIVYRVAPWVDWKETTAVVRARNLYPHSALLALLARHKNSKSQSGCPARMTADHETIFGVRKFSKS